VLSLQSDNFELLLNKAAYRIFTVLFLLSVFLTPMILQDIHVMLEHHEVERVCDAPGDDEHLHDQENHHRSCVLGHINFSEYLDLAQPQSELHLSHLFHQLAISAISVAPEAYTPVAQQRGPPQRV